MSALGMRRDSRNGAITGIPREILNNISHLFSVFYQAIQTSGAQVLSIVITPFPPNDGCIGYTIFATLAESHARLETTPENGELEYEIETCGEKADPQYFVDYLSQNLNRR